MSGFFGIVRQDGRPIDEQLLVQIANKLSFRGPDGTCVWVRGNVAGSFALMRTGPAIQASQQPVFWQNRFFLWGDLRLDGQEELRKQLAESDPPLDVDATTEELLLRAWTKWGPACLERVIGDFCFALWDAREQTLWCARDFIGPRPFYYAHVRGVFCFSNTMDILHSVPAVSRDLDQEFLGDFLAEGWNTELTRTVYRDIRRVAPGHVLKFSDAGVETRRFRVLPIEDPLRLNRPEDYLEAYREVLNSAVADRLPRAATALYLSGGLDSSSVCAIAAQIATQRRQKELLKAFTLSWEAFFEDHEPDFAKITAEFKGISLEVLKETELIPFEGLENGEVRIPEPGHEVFFIRERRQSQKIATHSNVILSGDGGDDILTGQGWPYLVHLWRRGAWKGIAQEYGRFFWIHKKIPPLRAGFRSKLRRLLEIEDSFAGFPEWINPDFVARANLRQRWLESRSRKSVQRHPFHPGAYEALHDGSWGEILESEDAGWHGVRLETRAPLLDLRLLAFLLRLPPVPWCVDKELCREAMRALLPASVVERPKTPLLREPVELCADRREWITKLPEEAPKALHEFVNWSKWCETFHHSKGSLNWRILRPVNLLYWMKAVENSRGIL
jgi:asparagine synthase (glutamine-hydrolysing)